METRLPWRPTRGSLTSPSYLVRNRTLGPPLENHPEAPPSSRRGGPSSPAWPRGQPRDLSPNASGGLTPFSPPSELQEIPGTYIHNTYNQRLPDPGPPTGRVSYNGGQGGIQLRASAAQLVYAHQQHVAPTAMQLHQERLALDDPAQRFNVNRGRPQIVATTHPGEFQGAGVVRLNTQQNGYEYRGKVQPWNGGNHNAVTVEREPQVQRGNPYVNEYRQPARPPVSNFRPPVQAMRPEHPTHVPPARTRMYQPQPTVNYGNPYVAAPPPAARVEQGGWNMNRNEMPRPEEMQRAPMRQPAFNEPYFRTRAPAARPDAHAQREQDKAPHCCARPSR